MRVALLLLLALAGPAAAVQPDEILADPALEARARELSKEIRCLVCRNESIDDSNADLARDLRILVRERVAAGDSDAEVLQFLVDRYGEFVLLKPRLSAGNAVLWLAGPALFLGGGLAAVLFLRRRRRAAAPAEAPLSAEEEAALREILGEDRQG
ncbi:cytochrome c-type biogenesis protein [Paralimibaculum aggregatum]|nr:cytochrome c-type biogenesis protein [Limibaculum sp. NKW23]